MRRVLPLVLATLAVASASDDAHGEDPRWRNEVGVFVGATSFDTEFRFANRRRPIGGTSVGGRLAMNFRRWLAVEGDLARGALAYSAEYEDADGWALAMGLQVVVQSRQQWYRVFAAGGISTVQGFSSASDFVGRRARSTFVARLGAKFPVRAGPWGVRLDLAWRLGLDGERAFSTEVAAYLEF